LRVHRTAKVAHFSDILVARLACLVSRYRSEVPLPALFISYSRVDSEFAIKLVRDLKAGGVAAWLDQVDIGPGVNWDEQIERALGLAEVVLVILSQHSATSENVKNEISHALELKKQVVPIVVTKAPVPLIITRLQREDFTGNYEAAFSKLMLRLRRGSRTDALEAITPSEVKRISATAVEAAAGERASNPSVEHNDSLNPATAAISPAARGSTRTRQIAGAAVALLVAAGLGGLVTNRLSGGRAQPAASSAAAASPIPAPTAIAPTAIAPTAIAPAAIAPAAIAPVTPPAPSASATNQNGSSTVPEQPPNPVAESATAEPAAITSPPSSVPVKSSVEMPTGVIRNDSQAIQMCPGVCATRNRKWKGVWSHNSCTCTAP
jgi:hypothetical protein